MAAAWQLGQDVLRCDVAWRDGQLYWQISHPDLPAQQTRSTVISDLWLSGQPVTWTKLIDGEQSAGLDGAPRLRVDRTAREPARR